MKRLLSIELSKLRGYRAFWIFSALYFMGLAGSLLSFESILNSFSESPMFKVSFNSFPEGWHYLSFIGGFFHYILAVIVIILICNEFSDKTVKQNIINGMSRTEWLTGKVQLMAFFALVSTLVYVLCALIVGFLESSPTEIGMIFQKTHFILAYFIQTMGYLMLAMMIGMFIRNTGIAIGIFFIYGWIIEKLITWKLPEVVADFFPLTAFNNMISQPFLNEAMMQARQSGPDYMAIAISIAWIGIFSLIGNTYMNRKDI